MISSKKRKEKEKKKQIQSNCTSEHQKHLPYLILAPSPPSSPLKQTSEVVWCSLMIKGLNSILGIEGSNFIKNIRYDHHL
jgi:hypothetical protein